MTSIQEIWCRDPSWEQTINDLHLLHTILYILMQLGEVNIEGLSPCGVVWHVCMHVIIHYTVRFWEKFFASPQKVCHVSVVQTHLHIQTMKLAGKSLTLDSAFCKQPGSSTPCTLAGAQTQTALPVCLIMIFIYTKTLKCWHKLRKFDLFILPINDIWTYVQDVHVHMQCEAHSVST